MSDDPNPPRPAARKRSDALALLLGGAAREEDELEAERTWALRTLQRHAQEWHLRRAEPSIQAARAYADAFLPHASDGRLYRTVGLTEPCRNWRDGAPITPAVFDAMGANISLYMRFVSGCIPIFAAASLVALVPIAYNLTGKFLNENLMQSVLVGNSLGNAPTLNALHGAADLVIVLLLAVALVLGTRRLRAESERLDSRRPSQLSAANYTLLVKGLPSCAHLQVKELREYFESWGEVITVAVSRANAKLIGLVRKREKLRIRQQELKVEAARVRAKGAPPRSCLGTLCGLCRPAARPDGQLSAKQQRQLVSLDHAIHELRKQVAPCTGICFVTFNEQRAAHTCLHALREAPSAAFAGEACTLLASFAPPPGNVVWENLEVGIGSRRARRALVNLILLAQCCISTYAITVVTNLNVNTGLDEEASTLAKILTMAWTTAVIIASNISIFILAPIYMALIERDHTEDMRELALAGKLLFFQVLNGMAAALSFLWTKGRGLRGLFDDEWYPVGGATVVNVLVADCFLINLVIEGFRVFDALPLRLLLAPRAQTQAAMNTLYAVENPLYLPFRMQLTLKFFVYGIGFGYAIPLLYWLTLAFFLISFVVDRSGLLRVFRGIRVTTDKLVLLLAMIYTCPLALLLHCLISFLCAHHIEIQMQGLESEESFFLAFKQLHYTLPNFSVALSLGLLIAAAIFAPLFTLHELALRRARKERSRRRFSRVPKVGTEAFVKLKAKLGSVSELVATRSQSLHRHLRLTEITSADGLVEADLVPFRELHTHGATARLYIPPLTATLLTALSSEKTLRQYSLPSPPVSPVRSSGRRATSQRAAGATRARVDIEMAVAGRSSAQQSEGAHSDPCSWLLSILARGRVS